MNRYLYIVVAILFFSGSTTCSLKAVEKKEIPLVILHTNDSHSQIEPILVGDGKGFGGVSRRSVYFRQVKKENPNVLILDAGDFNQGTPFFTLFKGDLEVELMNKLGYEVAAIGNHEFDNGQQEYARRLAKSKFSTVCANLDLESSPIKKYVQPYVIIKKGGLKIGIIGITVNLKNLVSASAQDGISYLDPVEVTNRYAKQLKERDKCDLVILLSHAGYQYQNPSTPSDITIGRQTENVDIIIGGHTHTYLKSETIVQNLNGEDVIIVQAGSKGEYVGRLDLVVSK